MFRYNKKLNEIKSVNVWDGNLPFHPLRINKHNYLQYQSKKKHVGKNPDSFYKQTSHNHVLSVVTIIINMEIIYLLFVFTF